MCSNSDLLISAAAKLVRFPKEEGKKKKKRKRNVDPLTLIVTMQPASAKILHNI